MNTVEFAVRGGIPYAIDFTNPAPDADVRSVGEANFEWMVQNHGRNLGGPRAASAALRVDRRLAAVAGFGEALSSRPSFTLGVEEEFQIIDPETFELKSNTGGLFDEGQARLKEEMKRELHAPVIEIGTPDLRQHPRGAARADAAARRDYRPDPPTRSAHRLGRHAPVHALEQRLDHAGKHALRSPDRGPAARSAREPDLRACTCTSESKTTKPASRS